MFLCALLWINETVHEKRLGNGVVTSIEWRRCDSRSFYDQLRVGWQNYEARLATWNNWQENRGQTFRVASCKHHRIPLNLCRVSFASEISNTEGILRVVHLKQLCSHVARSLNIGPVSMPSNLFVFHIRNYLQRIDDGEFKRSWPIDTARLLIGRYI